jgi:hypothetical protein
MYARPEPKENMTVKELIKLLRNVPSHCPINIGLSPSDRGKPEGYLMLFFTADREKQVLSGRRERKGLLYCPT